MTFMDFNTSQTLNKTAPLQYIAFTYLVGYNMKQAGAELCQAQVKLC
jgi:hypothetical protein